MYKIISAKTCLIAVTQLPSWGWIKIDAKYKQLKIEFYWIGSESSIESGGELSKPY